MTKSHHAKQNQKSDSNPAQANRPFNRHPNRQCRQVLRKWLRSWAALSKQGHSPNAVAVHGILLDGPAYGGLDGVLVLLDGPDFSSPSNAPSSPHAPAPQDGPPPATANSSQASSEGAVRYGASFDIGAIYKKTVEDLLAMDSPFWLMFAPVAADAEPVKINAALAMLYRHCDPRGIEQVVTGMIAIAQMDPQKRGFDLLIKSFLRANSKAKSPSTN